MNYNYYQEGGKKVYVDNTANRRLGRVGKPYGSPGSNKHVTVHKVFYLLFSVDILVFDKRYDLGFKISSLDKKNKPNKELKKYIDFNTLVSWHKKHIMDMGKYISTDTMGVTINDVKKDSDGVMSVKITTVYDTPRQPSDKEPLYDNDIEFIGQMIGNTDDDGNYPVKVKKSTKYKTASLVGSKLISFRLDDKKPIRR